MIRDQWPMTVEQILAYWNSKYAPSLPLGYHLRKNHPEQWFRIHSLPGGQRYAKSAQAYSTILHRQNLLLEDLIGAGTEVAILHCQFGDVNRQFPKHLLTPYGEFQQVKVEQIPPQTHSESLAIGIFVKFEAWYPKQHDALLRAIANDETRAIFVCPSRNCIVAPYDGGVDVILNSSKRRDALKEKYKAWLSPRLDGL